MLEVTDAPTASPSASPSRVPSVSPTEVPSRAPSSPPSQNPTTSSMPTDTCVARDMPCNGEDLCCGGGSLFCTGVCTRVIPRVDKDSEKNQYKLSDGARIRGSGSTRRKLLKGSGPNHNY